MNDLYNIIPVGPVLSQRTIDFVQHWHYSKSCRSMKQKHVFLLQGKDGSLKGVAIYGQPMGKNSDQEALELRRFCLIDDTPRNSESFFLAATLRWLRKRTKIGTVVTFADPNAGHTGIIYKASNFKYDGLEDNGNPRTVIYNGKQVHLRQYYQKKAGHYTKNALMLQEAVASGKASIIKQERKIRYLYNLR